MRLLDRINSLLYRVQHRRLFEISRRFSDYTMIPRTVYVANLALANRYRSARGAIVECGTWKGGMIGGIASILGRERDYFLFDSFEGLPDAQSIDGAAAIEWQQDKENPEYYDNCSAREEEAEAAMSLAGIEDAKIFKGFFENTLHKVEFPDGIGILRMDADWYESTMQILDVLFPQVNAGGVIIIDDYYAWEGCSKAVHDYLSKHKRSERIRQADGVCYIIKE